MRFLADENFPGVAVSKLRSAGNDVVWVRTDAPGMPDSRLLAWAIRDRRIVLTFDKDFGELARGSSMPPTSGVILFRLRMSKPQDLADRIAAIVAGRSDWLGHFSVVQPGRIRMRKLA